MGFTTTGSSVSAVSCSRFSSLTRTTCQRGVTTLSATMRLVRSLSMAMAEDK